jgi:hypothetical protein
MNTARILLVVLFLVMRALSSTAHAHDGRPSMPPGLSEAGRAASGAPGAGPLAVLTGRLHAIYGDAAPGLAIGGTLGFVLVEDTGQVTELVVPDHVLAAAGGRRAVNGQRVTVTGQAPVLPLGTTVGHRSLLLVQALQGAGGAGASALAAASGVTGPQPWVTILCRFADEAGVTPHPVSWFETLMLGSAAAPSLDHYWREVSYGQVQLTGSDVVGWYTLPQPRSYYVYGTPEALDHQRAVNDCTAVADADVYFPSFVGINLAFNDNLDCCAWGGSWTLTRDGQTRSYRVTWLPPWGYENQGPVAHEMGHGFGLPHSSGPYSATYDSAWDVMSGLWDNCPPYDAVYRCVGTHTIAYHKDLLGWIPAARRYVAADGTSQTITLEPLGVAATANYMIAKIPIGSSTTQFYTVEVRRFLGYDSTLRAEAVIIHRVDTTRSDRDAQVVDPDGNGDPDDAGARWLPGETFLDSVNGISVTVVGQTSTGFQVTVAKTVSSYTLSVTVSGTGTVTSSPAGINCSAGTCAASFPVGSTVVLTASSGTLSAWGGACAGSASTCNVTMTASNSVTATFTTPVYLLAVSPVPTNGTVTGPGINCGGDCSESFASGTPVTLTAGPAVGYQVGTWTGCASVSGNQCTVTMTQARTVSVTFVPVASYTLTISPVPSKGTITGPGVNCGRGSTDCTEAFAPGTAVVLTATPAKNQRVGSWTGCASFSGNQCTVNMTQPRTVSATFVPK